MSKDNMGSKDRTLSDEELRERIELILHHNGYVKRSELLLDLFNTQKRLHAESVIGEDDDIDNEYGSYSSQDMVNSSRNELRAEQRARIK